MYMACQQYRLCCNQVIRFFWFLYLVQSSAKENMQCVLNFKKESKFKVVNNSLSYQVITKQTNRNKQWDQWYSNLCKQWGNMKAS